jgi:hypothetical protein
MSTEAIMGSIPRLRGKERKMKGERERERASERERERDGEREREK